MWKHNDCGPDACGNENCVDEVNCYTCNCHENHEFILQVNGPVCVAKECEIFSRTWFSESDHESVMMPCQL